MRTRAFGRGRAAGRPTSTARGQQLGSHTERLGPGDVPVFDDLELSTAPGRELCFIATAWFNDKGKFCLTTT